MDILETYKNSEIVWIDKIPQSWKLNSLKHICTINKDALTEKTDGDFEFDYIDISNVNSDGKISSPTRIKFKEAPSRARRKVNEGDTILSTVRTYLKAIAFIDKMFQKSIVSTGFAVLTPKTNINPRYLYYLVRSESLIDQVTYFSKGVSYPAINSSDLSTIRVAYTPSQNEQAAIAKYLDKKTSQIDTIIKQKELLLEKLHAKRQAIINEAVTKGINPNVRMKPTGVEWLGDIPEHWRVGALRWFCDLITDGSHFSPETQDVGYKYISVKDVTDDNRINFHNCKKISQRDYDLLVQNGCKPEPGDVLLSKDGTIGRAVVVNSNNDFVVLSSLALIRPAVHKFNPQFMWFLFTSSSFVSQMYSYINGSALKRLTISLIKQLIVTVPSKDEQSKIVAYLNDKLIPIEKVIHSINIQLGKIREYRQSLISEVVTGKIKIA